MQILKIEEILLGPNRQRREFEPDELAKLSDSIEANGLLHPIVVRETPEGWMLVAGERRLRAIKDYLLPLSGQLYFDGDQVREGYIPAVTLGELTELEAEEAELEENIRRTDLTWQERAAATSRLSSLRARQAIHSGEAPPTTASIAEEVRGTSVGHHAEATRREIIVSRHLGSPEVQKAKTLDEAFKILRRREADQKSVALAESVGRTFHSGLHRVIQEDAIQWLSEEGVRAGSAQFDCIITDPPYGMNADEFGDAGGAATNNHSYVDDEETFREAHKALAYYGFSVCKPQAHLYLFCDIDRFGGIKELFNLAGWWVHRTPIIWHKPAGNRIPWPGYGPQRKYELILFAIKGKKPIARTHADIITINADENLGLSAQKPVGLYSELLKRSCLAGDSVLDPFAGTGPIFPAAHDLRIKATGVEIASSAYGMCLKRIEQLKEVA